MVRLQILLHFRFDKIRNKHNKDKILFATDSPWSDVADTIAVIRSLNCPESEKEAILGGNAKQLLGMK